MVTTLTQKRLDDLGCVLGLDCSKYQKDIDWKKVKAAGVEFAFIKITEGTTYSEDTLYDLNNRVLDAQKNGVKIGYYHFARPGNIASPEDDANEEAQNVLSHLGFLPKSNLPLVLDIEAYSDTILWDNKIEHMDRFIKKFLEVVGVPVVIYSYKSFLETNTTNLFGNHPLWIAGYINTPETSLPAIPKGWSEWKIWQFTEKGQIDGYVGDIDLNIMKKDFFSTF